MYPTLILYAFYFKEQRKNVQSGRIVYYTTHVEMKNWGGMNHKNRNLDTDRFIE